MHTRLLKSDLTWVSLFVFHMHVAVFWHPTIFWLETRRQHPNNVCCDVTVNWTCFMNILYCWSDKNKTLWFYNTIITFFTLFWHLMDKMNHWFIEKIIRRLIDNGNNCRESVFFFSFSVVHVASSHSYRNHAASSPTVFHTDDSSPIFSYYSIYTATFPAASLSVVCPLIRFIGKSERWVCAWMFKCMRRGFQWHSDIFWAGVAAEVNGYSGVTRHKL